MKIWHISDTHGKHKEVIIPDLSDIDVIIHSGDESNARDPIKNEVEFRSFIEWYSELKCPNKILIAGNHSIFISENKRFAERLMKEAGIIYLNKSHVIIDDVVFYGDPTTPSFGNWVFTTDRNKMSKHTALIPYDCDVLITHGPAKNTLDITSTSTNTLKPVGCSSLKREISLHEHIKLHCFGHIHSSLYDNIDNSGLLIRDNVIYSNGACQEDGNNIIKYHGNIIKI